MQDDIVIGGIIMTKVDMAIKAVLDKPIKEISVKDAQKKLRECGILDKNNNLTPAYQGILTKKN